MGRRNNFKDFQKQLKKIENDVYDRVQKLHGRELTLSDLLDDDFISRKTVFNSQEEFVNKAPDINLFDHANINQVNDKKLDEFIDQYTEYPSWNMFIEAAYIEKL
ncbi:hypothetical protein [Halobacillus massiliensis]|uniref:hypothetical protein n=1 Tax=Halobacillus massiliensis TaxID=1926286 RepID=UPI0009E61546|nr:hypothetical protein [Halobacillus massiliensis]